MLGLGLKGEDEDSSDPGEARMIIFNRDKSPLSIVAAGLCICCRPTSRREPFPGPSSLPMAEQDGGQHMIR